MKTLGEKATHAIAIGACAPHGGVSAARPNPVECVSVQKVLSGKVIEPPGCMAGQRSEAQRPTKLTEILC